MEDLLQEIQNRASLVQVVGREVELKKRGKNYYGLCPFHVEKTPSFTVNEEKGLFYCFGCQEGGNVFQFWMKYKNLPFYEALIELGKQVGIDVRSHESQKDRRRIPKDSYITEILHIAQKKFQGNLYSEAGRGVREYLKRRGLRESSIRGFGLGFAKASSSDLKELLIRKGFSKKEQLESHMVSESGGGKLFDSFQNRLMFPIWDEWGHIVAFGSRALGNETFPKYLNSQENPYFKKRTLLYGLNLAKEWIQKSASVLLVEGYMDVALCHQHGLLHAVGPLGTSLTEFQIQKLSRYAKKLFLAFDGDLAGEKATNRAIELALNTDMETIVIEMPKERDPGDYLAEFGREAWDGLFQQEAVSYYLKSRWSKYKEKNSFAKRQYLNSSYSFLQKIHSEIQREEAFKKLAELLRVSVNAIKKDYQQLGRKYPTQRAQAKRPASDSTQKKIEQHLFFTLLNHPKWIQKYQHRIIFEDPWTKKGWNLFLECLNVDAQKETLRKTEERVGKRTMDRFLDRLSVEDKKIIHEVLLDRKYEQDPEKQVQDCIKNLRLKQIEKQKINNKEKITELHSKGKREGEKAKEELEKILLEERQYLINEEKKFQ